MIRKDMQDYQMFTKVADYIANNVGLFPKLSAASEILEGLESAVQHLSDHAQAQVSAESALRVGRNSRAAARDALKRRLAQSEQVARALNSDKFRMPGKRNDPALIVAGKAFAVDAEELKKDFIKHGLPPDEMAAAVEALEHAILDCTAGKIGRASAIREFGNSMVEAMAYVKRLDVLVDTTLADNPAALASWAVVRAVNRSARRKPAATPPDPTPAVTPVAA
jgi:hypothetical protein